MNVLFKLMEMLPGPSPEVADAMWITALIVVACVLLERRHE